MSDLIYFVRKINVVFIFLKVMLDRKRLLYLSINQMNARYLRISFSGSIDQSKLPNLILFGPSLRVFVFIIFFPLKNMLIAFFF